MGEYCYACGYTVGYDCTTIQNYNICNKCIEIYDKINILTNGSILSNLFKN